MWSLLKLLIASLVFINTFGMNHFTVNPPILPDFSSKKEALIRERQDFIEINLEENKLSLFERGILKDTFNILAKGNPDIWGGTPAGLYYVLRKHKVSYSNISNVYMPYSIHFYGKYYIHGEPYYRNGKKLKSSFSGGCIRLDNLSAKEVFNFAKKNMPVLVIDQSNKNSALLQVPNEISLSTKSYLVADLDSGQVLLKKNYLTAYPIGELSYLLVASVVAENVDLRRKIKITESMLPKKGVSRVLKEGQKYGVVELLYPMLITSSKEAMIALTYFLGQDKTKALIQEKAEAIMMERVEFVSFQDLSQNKASAKDLFYLARYILFNRSPLFNITKGELVDFAGQFKNLKLKNQNIFSKREDFIGGKTGFVPGFGKTGLFVFCLKNSQRSHRIAIIILGANDIKKEVEKILTWLKGV